VTPGDMNKYKRLKSLLSSFEDGGFVTVQEVAGQSVKPVKKGVVRGNCCALHDGEDLEVIIRVATGHADDRLYKTLLHEALHAIQYFQVYYATEEVACKPLGIKGIPSEPTWAQRILSSKHYSENKKPLELEAKAAENIAAIEKAVWSWFQMVEVDWANLSL
jgi:hypothetical protein